MKFDYTKINDIKKRELFLEEELAKATNEDWFVNIDNINTYDVNDVDVCESCQ